MSERFELGDELAVAAEREVGLDPFFERGESHPFETRDSLWAKAS